MNHVRGAKSFDELMVNGSHVKKCVELGLKFDDSSLIEAMYESVNYRLPSVSRRSFALLLTHVAPDEPKTLWEIFKEYLSDDIFHEMLTTRARLVLFLNFLKSERLAN